MCGHNMKSALLEEILNQYRLKCEEINSVINSFRDKLQDETEYSIICELAYAILAAGSSAVSAQRGECAIAKIYEKLHNMDEQEISAVLKAAGCRFYNVRGRYIAEALHKLRTFSLREEIKRRLKNKEALRDFLVENFKGIGYKEASHFLRNIGVFGLAILDKHILNSMVELGVIDKVPERINKRSVYLELEKKFIMLAERLGLTVEQLDLLLWSRKNGRIMK